MTSRVNVVSPENAVTDEAATDDAAQDYALVGQPLTRLKG